MTNPDIEAETARMDPEALDGPVGRAKGYEALLAEKDAQIAALYDVLRGCYDASLCQQKATPRAICGWIEVHSREALINTTAFAEAHDARIAERARREALEEAANLVQQKILELKLHDDEWGRSAAINLCVYARDPIRALIEETR